MSVTQIERTLDREGLTLPATITKRDGRSVPFDIGRIENAVRKCYGSLDEEPMTSVRRIATSVANAVASKYDGQTPTVEQIQDLVETTLFAHGEFTAARHYITWREERAKQRMVVPEDIRAVFAADDALFPTALQKFQFYDKYSRFNWDWMRRETYHETVDRNIGYLQHLVEEQVEEAIGEGWEGVLDRLRQGMLAMEAMPSMRSLAMAGEAAIRNSLAIYNCSYMPVADVQAFVEALLVSMAGCGVGYSVERHYVERFDRVQRQTGERLPTWMVDDSTEGWAETLQRGLDAWMGGRDIDFDFTFVRPKGTPLRIKGGRASGPEPLRWMLTEVRRIILARQGTFLRPIDAHDIMCLVGGAAVSGGVRRTAMIALFSWDDTEMRDCKSGTNFSYNGKNEWRQNANNSAVWPEVLSQMEITRQMLTMAEGYTGEPGIFSRANANRTRPPRRVEADFGTNPCGEINLRPFGLCNLSIAVARPGDTLGDLKRKVELATIFGTIQSTATTFPGMREEWRRNCEEERLLGVDLLGHMDLGGISEEWMDALREHAVEVNAVYAAMLGISPAAAITCDKPAGNSSVLLRTASGIHAWWSPFYVRNVTVGADSPLFKVLSQAGVPMEPKLGSTAMTATQWIASFPVAAPEGAITRKDRSALDQCDYWLRCKQHWTEHNPSVTVTYQPHEIIDVIKWVDAHQDVIGGMTFLPADDAVYPQSPYIEISQEEYEERVASFPDIDFSLLYAFEETDMTEAAQTLACVAGGTDC